MKYMRDMKYWSSVVFIILSLALNACSSRTDSSTADAGLNVGVNVSTGKAPELREIEIANFKYSPAELRIDTGDSVVWTNRDSVPHTVTSDAKDELDSGSIADGKSYSHVFEKEGTYSYYCEFHTGMKAKIIVK